VEFLGVWDRSEEIMHLVGRRCIAALVVIVVTIFFGCNSHNLPTGTIEKKYYAPGPWAKYA
jgi:hypothetical protein